MIRFVVKCKLCNERIELNRDSQENRAAGIDPAQQLRRHLQENHFTQTFQLAAWGAWLIDRIAFRPEPWCAESWRIVAHKLIDHFVDTDPEIEPDPGTKTKDQE